MKKLIFAVSLAIASFQAAAETPQVELVKRIYREARQTENDVAILNKYADNSLKQALRIANRANMCLDFSPIWGDQDYNSKAKISFTQNGNQVRATSHGAMSMNVSYALNCNGNSCRITDIINDGTSLKRYINQECR